MSRRTGIPNDSPKQRAMVDRIRVHLNLTTLKYQTLTDMVAAIDLPKEKVCTYCWDAVG
jgi:amidophosphoribosyltransferase